MIKKVVKQYVVDNLPNNGQVIVESYRLFKLYSQKSTWILRAVFTIGIA